MTTHSHPPASDLLAAVQEPDQATATLDHINDCLACRVRLSRLRDASGLVPGTEDIFQRIIEASTPLPAIVASLVADADHEPEPNEIWRVGRSEALLVWVRRVFDDGVADVIPLVLDVELADQYSILVAADATPLATDLAAIVALRTHVHIGAFLNRVGRVDISREVAEVMTSVQESRRPSGVRVGPPISDDRDQRLEYRQALRDLLAELSPSAWLEAQDAAAGDPQPTAYPVAVVPDDDITSVKARLSERLPGVSFPEATTSTVAVDQHVTATRVLKLFHLDTTILIVTLDIDSEEGVPNTALLVRACQTLNEPDVDAIAVAVPHGDWPTQLFTSASMRTGLQLPSGRLTKPRATSTDHGLVDTLCKHLEGVVLVWDAIEQSDRRIGRTDIRRVAAQHAETSIEQIAREGMRARQTAKKQAWQTLPTGLGERLASFVVAVVNSDATEALADLIQEIGDDSTTDA